jgi:hypothetical protein
MINPRTILLFASLYRRHPAIANFGSPARQRSGLLRWKRCAGSGSRKIRMLNPDFKEFAGLRDFTSVESSVVGGRRLAAFCHTD